LSDGKQQRHLRTLLPVNIDAATTHYLAAPGTGAVQRHAERLGALATIAKTITSERWEFQDWGDKGEFRDEKMPNMTLAID